MELAKHVRRCVSYLENPEIKQVGHAECGMIFDKVYGPGRWPAQLPRVDGRSGPSNSFSKQTVAAAIQLLFKKMEEERQAMAGLQSGLLSGAPAEEEGEVINIGPLPDSFKAPPPVIKAEPVIKPEDILLDAPPEEPVQEIPEEVLTEVKDTDVQEAMQAAVAQKIAEKDIQEDPEEEVVEEAVSLTDLGYTPNIVASLAAKNITTEQGLAEYVTSGNSVADIPGLEAEDVELLEEIVNDLD